MKNIKILIKPILTGILATLIMAAIMLKITMNFQILLFFGSMLFFLSGFINSKSNANSFLKAFFICVFFSSLFIITVLEQLPELKYFVVVYFISCLLGLYFNEYKKKAMVTSVLLVIVISFLSVKVIPRDIENRLTKTKNEALPSFEIHELSGAIVDSKQLKGKTVVLDFFGTWCKPCVKELVELDKIQQEFQDDKDVVFYLINADIGGDTPEKFKAFLAKHNYKFKVAYDANSQIYKQLNLQNLGLPTLLLIDKSQNIRLQHVGYNTAETNFSENIIKTINRLK